MSMANIETTQSIIGVPIVGQVQERERGEPKKRRKAVKAREREREAEAEREIERQRERAKPVWNCHPLRHATCQNSFA